MLPVAKQVSYTSEVVRLGTVVNHPCLSKWQRLLGTRVLCGNRGPV